ncbi:hypothetical protein [Bergeyella sp. RCAD1439]|uniref:hypothetical protein n=1 Tax=Bergeyella anatis TaxID=3113737 RepID=UPI002E16E5F9|nr:hypothetical protein [Bergeyella sp. RCAD1439]
MECWGLRFWGLVEGRKERFLNLSTERKERWGGRDEQGCLGAEGQTWSKLKQDCVQVFNVGQNPLEVDSGAAVVIISADGSMAELFLPERKGSVILVVQNEERTLYVGEGYEFDNEKGGLSVGGQIKYQRE